MLRKPLLSLFAVLALAAGMAACGDDEEPATDAPAQQETATGESTPAPTSEDLDAAIENCKQSVRDRPELSEDVKNDLVEICDEAKSGDPEQLKETTRKVCERIVEEQVPEGAARDQALETCKTATQ